MQITAPISMAGHIEKIARGEYDLPYELPAPRRTPRVILDIGANVGGFAVWAHQRWPGSMIYCYEPLSSNFEFLKKNLAPLRNVLLFNRAVGDPTKTKLYLGKNNCGENSFFDLGEQLEQHEDVVTIEPNELPSASILKIDTEGSELDILSRLDAIDYDAILLEYHSEKIRRRIDSMLDNYSLVGGEARSADRGTLKYVHNRLLPRIDALRNSAVNKSLRQGVREVSRIPAIPGGH
jgi:FkbM family methyltransferase